MLDCRLAGHVVVNAAATYNIGIGLVRARQYLFSDTVCERRQHPQRARAVETARAVNVRDRDDARSRAAELGECRIAHARTVFVVHGAGNIKFHNASVPVRIDAHFPTVHFGIGLVRVWWWLVGV